MIKSLKYLVVATILATTCACETDLKINADYDQIAIVYGILDPTDTVHIIKINRTFLGLGNALEFAKEPDSTKASFNQPPIVEKLFKGQVIATYQLRDTVIGGKPEGTFYSGTSVYYCFNDPLLFPSSDHEYRLSFVLNGKSVSAKTVVLGKSTQTSPSPGDNSFEFITNDVRNAEPKYKNVSLKVSTGINVKRVEAVINFSYEEQYLDGSPSQQKTLNLAKTSLLAANSKTREEITNSFSGAALLDQISANIDPNPNVKQRVIGKIELLLTGTGEDLNTYIEVNNPLSGVLQERPEFTNVNNGIGIFSSKYDQASILPVGDRTSRALAIQSKYIDLNFCSTRIAFATEADVLCQP